MYRLLLVLLLTSCLPKEKAVTKSDNSNSAPNSNETVLYSELVGEWKTSCVNGSGESYQLTFTFNQDGTSSLKEEFFYGIDCITQDSVWTSYYDYVDNEGNTDFERTKVTILAQHSDTVDYFNTPGDEWCGISDWVINEIRDVTNFDCEAFPTDSTPISTTYTINGNTLEFFNYFLFENEEYYKI